MADFKQQLKAAYNADAERRDKSEGKREEWKERVRQQFVDLLKSENKSTILELGAGAGLDSQFFKDQGFEVLAVDLSEEMVKMCQKRGVEAKVLDFYELDTLGKTFDGVFSLNSLLHVPKADVDRVLEQIYKVLNPGGIFFYGVYGGMDREETFTDPSKMNMPRYFSFLSDETIQEVAKTRFEVLSFEAIEIESKTRGLHFQALFLEKSS